MKIFFAILILIFNLYFIGCSKIEKFKDLTERKIETENLENEQPDAPPILEITQDAQGMRDVTGKTLFFNLYADGIIEFEYTDDKKKIAGRISKAEEVSTLKRTKISKEELEKFTDLLNSQDFQKTEIDYERNCCCTDASLNYNIKFRDGDEQKNIALNNYCDIQELKNSQARYMPHFPKVLSDLMILVDNSRWKHLPDKSSNHSQ